MGAVGVGAEIGVVVFVCNQELGSGFWSLIKKMKGEREKLLLFEEIGSVRLRFEIKIRLE